jgi:TM2 domain-containing membrane protein YozV
VQPLEQNPPAMQDSVVGGNLHTGNVVHNHYHTAPQQAVPVQTIIQQAAPTTVTMAQLGNKDVVTAYLLWFLVGWIGIHRFYLGNIGMGLLYMFTFGFFGLGWIIDAFLIPDLVKQANGQVIIIR